MKFRCERDVLVKALATAGRASAGRGAARAVIRVDLQGDTLTLTGRGPDDLTISVMVRDRLNGLWPGSAVLPARQVSKVVKSLPAGEVLVEVAGGQARITASSSELALGVDPVDEFPRPPELAGESVTLDAAELAAALRQVVPAASSSDARPILTGVLMAAEAGGLRLVATDSYRLAVRDLPGWNVLDEGRSVLVPALALDNLTRVLAGVDTVTMRLGERDVRFDAGPVWLTTTLIGGEFPAYKGLIPSGYPNRLTVDRKTLVEGVRRMKPFARNAIPVRLVMSDGRVDLVVTDGFAELARETVDDVKYEGAKLTVGFDPEYLLHGLKALSGDEALIETADAAGPALVTSPGHPEFVYLMMPVQVGP